MACTLKYFLFTSLPSFYHLDFMSIVLDNISDGAKERGKKKNQTSFNWDQQFWKRGESYTTV